MRTIANNIGGDSVALSQCDKVQEVRLSALAAVEAYSRKTSLLFEDFVDTPDFNKYIKTCMWNKKSKFGAKLSKRFGITNLVNLDNVAAGTNVEFASGHPDPANFQVSAQEVISLFDDVSLNTESLRVIEYIINDPQSIKPNGNVNMKKLASVLNISKRQAASTLEKVRFLLKDYDPLDTNG